MHGKVFLKEFLLTIVNKTELCLIKRDLLCH